MTEAFPEGKENIPCLPISSSFEKFLAIFFPLFFFGGMWSGERRRVEVTFNINSYLYDKYVK